MPDLLLSAADLSYSTPGGRPLIRKLSFSVCRGEVAAVTGPNGVGKSTLLSVIRGEVKPDSGSFHLPVAEYSYLPQLHNRRFHLPLSLRDVLYIGERTAASRNKALGFGLLTEAELDIPWNTASGGERQKALITRIIAEGRDLLILDEPTNHLDGETRRRLLGLLLDYVVEQSVGVLIVCHDQVLAEVGGECDERLKVLNLGGFVQ